MNKTENPTGISERHAVLLRAMWDAYGEVCVGLGRGDAVERMKAGLEGRFEGFINGLIATPPSATEEG